MRHSARRFLPGRPSGRVPGSSPGLHQVPAAGAVRWRLVALPILVAGLLAGCSSLTPIEKLVIAQDAEPLLAQIRDGAVDVNQPLPWGGGLGIRPSYFTPLCAAAFVGATSAFAELLTLGADVDASCGESSTPRDLVMRHPSGSKAAAMRALLQARGVDSPEQPRYVQARM